MKTMEKLKKNGISLDYNVLTGLCKKYCVNELAVFGSSIRDDFTPNSDVDILVSFVRNSNVSLFGIIALERELSQLLDREVDIVEKDSLKNPIRREKILANMEIIYAD
jgi:predicted nucleotidyltransferase